jgi:hypothetical protein
MALCNDYVAEKQPLGLAKRARRRRNRLHGGYAPDLSQESAHLARAPIGRKQEMPNGFLRSDQQPQEHSGVVD